MGLMKKKSKTQYECLNCGKILSKNNNICPFCGSKKRKIYKSLDGNLTFFSKLNGIAQNSKNFILYRFNKLTKIAGKSKNIAKELLFFDRTNKKYTIKIHRVEELIKGLWKVKHNTIDKYRSKRRRL